MLFLFMISANVICLDGQEVSITSNVGSNAEAIYWIFAQFMKLEVLSSSLFLTLFFSPKKPPEFRHIK